MEHLLEHITFLKDKIKDKNKHMKDIFMVLSKCKDAVLSNNTKKYKKLRSTNKIFIHVLKNVRIV